MLHRLLEEAAASSGNVRELVSTQQQHERMIGRVFGSSPTIEVGDILIGSEQEMDKMKRLVAIQNHPRRVQASCSVRISHCGAVYFYSFIL